MKTITDIKTELLSNKKISDLVFILWAGGAALLSYSLVYALRKPFTAATFDGLDAFGLDYKVLVTIVQILGYLIAKEAEWTAVRIVMAGRLAGLSADAIRERLRDAYV